MDSSDSDLDSDSEYHDRILELAERARHDRETIESSAVFDEESDEETEERAMEYLRTGLGPTIGLYIEARTGEEPVRLSTEEMALLERAVNDWLAVYARCYDVALDPEFTVREAAELLIETHNIRDTAQLLTQVPASGRTGTND